MATYYVAIGGNNANPGTITHPLATINEAWSRVSSGTNDIIYVRGGEYTYSILGITNLTNKDGVDINNRLSVLNYPGETPVIDFTDYGGSSATGMIEVENCDYLHVRGFELKHNLQNSTYPYRLGYGIRVKERVNYSLFEQLNIHHCGGWGIVVSAGSATPGNQSSNNTFYRCDSHHHADRYGSDPWEGSDGFLINSYSRVNPANRSLNIYFTECRAWMNSDDGWDNRLCNATIFYDKCWAFWNGFEPGETEDDPDSFVHPSGGGDGYGFKLGSRYSVDTALVERTLTRCVSFQNYHTGYQHARGTDSTVYGGVTYYEADSAAVVYNCTAYANGSLGFNFGSLDVAVDTIRNCISYASGTGYDYVNAGVDDTYNASNASLWYQRNFSVQAADFASLTNTGVDGARGPNGELPELTFLHLASDSDLIDAGIDVGLEYSGDAPDLGAFEYPSIIGVEPTASFTADPLSTYPNTDIEFTDTSSESPTSWMWVFGDGSTSTSQNPTHQYSVAGTYTVQLTVYNSYGNDTEVKTDYITVVNPPPPPPLGDAPVAAFIANTTGTYTGETVYFTDQSLNTPTSWSWIFGDGITSTLQSPTHIYNTPGIYTVSLSVENEYGNDEEIKVNYMVVLNPNPPEGCLAQIPLVRFFIV